MIARVAGSASALLSSLQGRLHSLDRVVLVAGIAVRLAAVGMLGLAFALVWAQYPRPQVAAAVAGALALTTVVVLVVWLRDRAVRAHSLAFDLPVGAAALLAGPWIAPHSGYVGWAFFAFPYTVLVSFTVGLACRRVLSAVAAGLLWAVACSVGWVWVHHSDPIATALTFAPSYLVNPLIGWLVARGQRRTAAAIAQARAVAVAEAAELAAQRERRRHARALHDRVLQTLEALVRDGTVDEPDLRERLRAQADWLRSYVETGRADPAEDLSSGLVAAARAARRRGLAVELNDAALRPPATVAEPSLERREALLEATHQLLTALAGRSEGTVVRVAPQRGGVLVSILASGPTDALDSTQLALARSRIAEAGGTVTVEPVPYLELWVPTTAEAANLAPG